MLSSHAVGLKTQLVEFCTGIARVRIQVPLMPEISGLPSLLVKYHSNGDDRVSLVLRFVTQISMTFIHIVQPLNVFSPSSTILLFLGYFPAFLLRGLFA